MSLTDKEIEGRLSEWLEREAARVGAGESFTPGAYVLARRRRTRKRLGAVVTGVALVAALLPTGIWLNDTVNRADRTPDVANTVRTTNAVETPDPQPSNPKPAGPIEKTIDPLKLPRGEAPGVPWYSDGVIHDGDQQIPLEPDLRAVTNLWKVDGGFVVQVDRPVGFDHTATELYLVRPGSAPKSLAEGILNRVAVSSDGRRFAWDERDRDTNVATLSVADAGSGEVVHTKRLVGRNNLVSVYAFLGSAVLLERSPNEHLSPIRIWEPDSGRISAWYDAKYLAGITPDGSLGAIVTDDNTENACYGVLSLPEKSKLWTSCEFDSDRVAFSPDRRHVAVVNYDQDEPPPDFVWDSSEEFDQWYDDHPPVTGTFVKDSRTGTSLLHLKDLSGTQVTWESDDTFLFEYANIDLKRQLATYGLIRCTIDGECEQVTDFRKRTSRATPPHVLAAN